MVAISASHSVRLVKLSNPLREDGNDTFDVMMKSARIRVRSTPMTTVATELSQLSVALHRQRNEGPSARAANYSRFGRQPRMETAMNENVSRRDIENASCRARTYDPLIKRLTEDEACALQNPRQSDDPLPALAVSLPSDKAEAELLALTLAAHKQGDLE